MTTLIGIGGAIIILIFFLLNQVHKIGRDDRWYDIGNVIGSLLLVTYAYLIMSIPFLILNTVWLVVSLKDAIRDKK